MSGAAVNLTAYWRESSYLRNATWLTCAVVALLVTLLPFAFWSRGAEGAIEVLIASGVCLLPGLIALWFSSQSGDTNHVLFSLLISMGLRLLPPLVICLALSLRSTGAEYFSFICYLLLFYMVTLALETFMSVRQLRSDR